MRRTVGLVLTLLLLTLAIPGWAYDGPVEKKVFTMPSYTTLGGQTIKHVRVGYERSEERRVGKECRL